MARGISKHAKVLIALLLASAIGIATLRFARKPDADLKKLATDFRSANQAETIKPMLELYHLDGSDESDITLLKIALSYELGLPIEEIIFEPLSGTAEEMIQFSRGDIAYGPTLKPRYKMRVSYKGEDRFSSIFTIGKTDSGVWKLILVRPTKSPARIME